VIKTIRALREKGLVLGNDTKAGASMVLVPEIPVVASVDGDVVYTDSRHWRKLTVPFSGLFNRRKIAPEQHL
jgi:hypothetical protein